MTFSGNVDETATRLREAMAKEREEERRRNAQLRHATDSATPSVESVLTEFCEVVWGKGWFHVTTPDPMPDGQRVTDAGYWTVALKEPAALDPESFRVFTYLTWDSPPRVVFGAGEGSVYDAWARTTDDSREALEAMLHSLLLTEEERASYPHMERVTFSDRHSFPIIRPAFPVRQKSQSFVDTLNASPVAGLVRRGVRVAVWVLYVVFLAWILQAAVEWLR